MRHWIRMPHREGEASRQAHADLPAGSYEREVGRQGFFGPATQIYHRHAPTGWSEWSGDFRPRAFDMRRIVETKSGPGDAVALLGNAYFALRFWRVDAAMDHLWRNGDGDDLLFIHQGGGDLFCDYGHLVYRAGDYILLPRGTMWRIVPTQPTAMLLIEATGGAYSLPDKGMLGAQAIFDPGMFDRPAIDEAFLHQQSAEDRDWILRVKRRNRFAAIRYPFNPLDAIGWQGDLFPVRINVESIRPVMSHRYHLPPSAHTTFLADRFVICTFAPRPFESDPGALKVPFFHNNDDYDEIIFYHAGDFFSRDHIKPGMMTLHPAGHTHGPHPKALKNAFQPAKAGTDEYAVMIDTRDAVELTPDAAAIEDPAYVESWRSPRS